MIDVFQIVFSVNSVYFRDEIDNYKMILRCDLSFSLSFKATENFVSSKFLS
jgi:hypothetical protein